MLEYNTIYVCRSLVGFMRSAASVGRMSLAKIVHAQHVATKIKLLVNTQAHAITATKFSIGEIKAYTSIEKDC